MSWFRLYVSWNKASFYGISTLFQDSAFLSYDTFVTYCRFDYRSFGQRTFHNLVQNSTFHNLVGISIITPAIEKHPWTYFCRRYFWSRRGSGTGIRKIMPEMFEKNLELKPTHTTKLNILWMLITHLEFDLEMFKILFLPDVNYIPSNWNTLFIAIRLAYVKLHLLYKQGTHIQSLCVLTV